MLYHKLLKHAQTCARHQARQHRLQGGAHGTIWCGRTANHSFRSKQASHVLNSQGAYALSGVMQRMHVRQGKRCLRCRQNGKLSVRESCIINIITLMPRSVDFEHWHVDLEAGCTPAPPAVVCKAVIPQRQGGAAGAAHYLGIYSTGRPSEAQSTWQLAKARGVPGHASTCRQYLQASLMASCSSCSRMQQVWLQLTTSGCRW
jgi:hypothetical protein